MEGKTTADVGLTFDDVLIVPNYSSLKRGEIDISTNLSPRFKMDVPFLSSPMDTVTMGRMAIALGKSGGLGVIHRNMTVENQAEEVKKAKREIPFVAAAIGAGRDLEVRLQALVQAGLDIVVIDSAHGFSKGVIEATKLTSEKYRSLTVISGNVATAAGCKALIEAGASVIRVGMGPGSICSTRIVAGIGVPQITSIIETAEIARKYEVSIIADGGIRFSGDIVKALAAGADTVMLGSLFAGCDEAPGKVVTKNGKKFKSYRGMGSVSAMKDGSAARYGQEYRVGQEKKLIAEGIESLVPYRGSLEEVVNQLAGGLRSGMYYAGVKNIRELQEKTRFIRVSSASMIESHPHDVIFK